MCKLLNKKTAILLLLSILTISQVVVIAFRIDYWPFSAYPMFSQTKSPEEAGAFQLFAAHQDGTLDQIPLEGHKQVWFVFNQLISGPSDNTRNIAEKMMLNNYQSYQQNQPTSKQPLELKLFFTALDKNSSTSSMTTKRQLVHSIKL